MKHPGSLRFVSWNVNSWTDTNSVLRKSILVHVKPDIVFLVETKLKGNNVINFKGYTWYGLNRKKQLRSAKCGSGGVGIFIRDGILQEWSFLEVDTEIDGLYVTSLTNKQNGFKILLGPCYFTT